MTTATTTVKSYQGGAIKIVAARAKAFTNENARIHKFRIEDGEIRVWDQVAGYYTICHILSKSAIRRILKLAKETT